MADEYTHRHSSIFKCSRNLLLGSDVPPFHPVVFKTPKPKIRHEMDLIYRIVSCMVAKHSKVRCIFQFEVVGLKEFILRKLFSVSGTYPPAASKCSTFKQACF